MWSRSGSNAREATQKKSKKLLRQDQYFTVQIRCIMTSGHETPGAGRGNRQQNSRERETIFEKKNKTICEPDIAGI